MPSSWNAVVLYVVGWSVVVWCFLIGVNQFLGGSVFRRRRGRFCVRNVRNGNYILLVSGSSCTNRSMVKTRGTQWNPRAKFIVSLKSNCTHMENTQFSRAILCELWGRAVTNPIVPFLRSNEHEGNDLHQHIADLAQSTYFELHTWYP